MTRKRAVNAAAHFEQLESLFAGMLEGEREFEELLATVGDRDHHDLIAPSLADCTRTLRALAATFARLEKTLNGSTDARQDH